MNKKNLLLEKKLNVNFTNKELLARSIIHKSFDSENNNEKFEFLGDRVLGLVISKKLLEIYPNEKEGVLDKKLAYLVNKNSCYEVGKNLNLYKYIYVGNSKKNLNIAQKKIISDCIEAIIGAIYLDKGFDRVEKFIIYNWSFLIKTSENVLK